MAPGLLNEHPAGLDRLVRNHTDLITDVSKTVLDYYLYQKFLSNVGKLHLGDALRLHLWNPTVAELETHRRASSSSVFDLPSRTPILELVVSTKA